jgi:hypothetical protein
MTMGISVNPKFFTSFKGNNRASGIAQWQNTCLGVCKALGLITTITTTTTTTTHTHTHTGTTTVLTSWVVIKIK